MPRRPRFCPAGMPVHVVQRGNNRQVCFAKEADMAADANWLGEYAKKFDVEVHAPCVRLVVTLIKSSFIEQRAREE